MSANGKLSGSELEVVEDDDRLNHATARAFRAAYAAWVAEGGGGPAIVEPAGSYRDFDVQYGMKHGIPSFAFWNLNPASKAGLADPGHSTHGLGDSLDALAGFQRFLLRRGHEFGLYRPYGDRDPNHWRYNGATIAGGAYSPLTSEPQRRPSMTARYIVAPGPIWAGIDLVAFRAQGGAIVTTVLATAEDLSRVYAFPAENVSRDELNRSVIAANLWVAQVVNASMNIADVDEAALAAALAPLLRVEGSDLTETEFKTYLEAKVNEVKASVASIPPAVIVEMKKPGN